MEVSDHKVIHATISHFPIISRESFVIVLNFKQVAFNIVVLGHSNFYIQVEVITVKDLFVLIWLLNNNRARIRGKQRH